MLLSCDIAISICSNIFPDTLIGSGLFEVFDLEGESDHQDSEGDRKDCDQPYQSHRAGPRHDEKKNTEQHRQYAVEDQPPFVFDGLAKLNGADDLQQACRDDPASDEIK